MAELKFDMVGRPHAGNFVQWAKDKPQVVVLSADLTASCEADDFREAYPQRFFSLGMAEQNMLSFAGGMAREGFEPWIHTFAVFLCRRPFDQVAMSVAYPNLRVRLVGFLPGITTPGGVTHQANDDLALMRVLPNMTILECGDATDVESVLDVAHGVDGPVYIRMLRGQVPRLFPRTEPMRLNQARLLADGTDLTVISSGVCTEEAMRVVAQASEQGLSLRHLHVSTLKPFDDPGVLAALSQPGKGVLVVENHSIIGGLGSAVAEVMAENAIAAPLVRLGMRDVYAQGASREYLMAKHGIDAAGIAGAVGSLLGCQIDLAPPSLPRPPTDQPQQAEDL